MFNEIYFCIKSRQKKSRPKIGTKIIRFVGEKKLPGWEGTSQGWDHNENTAGVNLEGGGVRSLHYTTLHYTTLHYTTLHYITLHYTTLH